MSARFSRQTAIHTVALLLALTLVSHGADGLESKYKNRKMTNPYPVLFANSLRNSQTPASLTASGTEAWRKKRAAETYGAPAHLLVAESSVLIVTSQKVYAYNAQGDELWSQAKWPESRTVLFGDALFSQSYQNETRLAKIDLNSGVVVPSEISVPGAKGKAKLIFYEPMDQGFIGCVFLPETQVLRDGKPTARPPQFEVYGKPYDDGVFIWVGEGHEKLVLPTLHLTKQNRLVLFGQTAMVVYNSDPPPQPNDAQTASRIEYPLQTVTTASADNAGTIYITGISDKQDWLVAVDLKGQTKWKWQCKDGFSPNRQSPAVCPNGTIIVMCGTSVCAVAEGKTAWQYATELNSPEFVTVTADNSNLVAAGRILFCIKDGKLVFKFDLDDTIVAPPVVEKNGSIYLLSPRELVRMI